MCETCNAKQREINRLRAIVRDYESMPLEFSEENDFTLKDGKEGIWITVGNASVYIFRNEETVSVSLYPRGHEDGDPTAEIEEYFSEIEALGKLYEAQKDSE